MTCSGNVWLFLIAAVQVLRGPLGTSAADSPCPDVFQYAGSPGSEYGIITVPNPYLYLEIDITVAIYVTAPVLLNSSAKLVPIDTDLRLKLAAGCRDPVLYRIDFPISSPLPTIKIITVNKNVICKGSKPNAVYVNTVKLQHAIYNERCNLSSLECPFIIQQTTQIRTQPSPNAVCRDTCTRYGIPAAHSFCRIDGGEYTSRGEYPWHAALYQFQGSSTVYRCGGTFVGTRTIITSAHCVTTKRGKKMSPKELIVYLGRYDLTILGECLTQKMWVQKIIRHSEYNVETFEADIALLILEKSVECTRFVRPVSLWDPSDTSLQNVIGMDGVVVGWGDMYGRRAGMLKMVEMVIVSTDTCHRRNGEFFWPLFLNKKFCAGSAYGNNPCVGDAGGGMVIPVVEQGDSKVWRLRGIASHCRQHYRFNNICDPSRYNCFTDVAQYLDWISVNII